MKKAFKIFSIMFVIESIILPLFAQGQKSHEFPNGLRLGNKE